MVPRGKMCLGAVWPAEVSTVLRLPPDKWLEIEPGRECPRVWMDCRALSTKAEHVTVPLMLHKSYCELTISLGMCQVETSHIVWRCVAMWTDT